ncbi:MAG: beta-propeller fold lactonase family protein, partial [Nocardioides sp.]
MPKRLPFVLTLGALAATSVFGVAPAAQAAPSDVVGHAYVNDNTAGVNTVAGFDRHADGSLTPMAGSPFAIGGAGAGGGLGSQGAIQASADGHYLIAVDAGSSQLSVLRLDRAGVPHLVGSPVSSGGVRPVSVTISSKNLVYVANIGNGGSNYTGFRLQDDGSLSAVPKSTVAVPEGSGVGDVFFNSTADRLVGTRDNTSLIDSFAVRSNGRLVAAVGSPFPAQSLGPIGAEFRPTNPSQLFVSNAHAGPGNGTVSAFNVDRTGVLTAIGDAYANGQTAPCWVEISHDGRYLFSVNTASATISSFSINADGSLVLLGNTSFRVGQGAVDARLSPDGSTLSVTGGSGHVVSTFAVNGGQLTEIAGSPVALPAGSSPTGLV